MRHCLICFPLLLLGCGPDLVATRGVPPDLLVKPVGYEGRTPASEGELVGAMLADRAALGQCVAQIDAIADLP